MTFGKPQKQQDLVCVSHSENDLAVLTKDAAYCYSGSTICKIPSCVATGSCTSLKDGGLAHILFGCHYQDNLKPSSADKSICKSWAGTMVQNVTDRIQRIYGVNTLKVLLRDTFNPKKNTVTQYTLQYNGYGGVAYMYFYCGVNHYMKDNYKISWFCKLAPHLPNLSPTACTALPLKRGTMVGPTRILLTISNKTCQ